MKVLHGFLGFLCITAVMILSLAGCSSFGKNDRSSTEDPVPVIDLAYAVENSGESLPLSDFVEDIELLLSGNIIYIIKKGFQIQ